MSQVLDDSLKAAVIHFWKTRDRQSDSQGDGLDRDRGSRSAVTGGKQMDGFVDIVLGELIAAGVPDSSISTGKRIELPGWFRAEKKWDLVVVHKGELVVALEFKSHIGPSFGNNFNNRTEEALGSATDIWAAYREGAFKPSSRPFLGYLMLAEDCAESRAPVRVKEPHFRVFGEFKGGSYQTRYAVLIEKLLRERLYDSACLLLAAREDAATGIFTQPHAELTFAKFLQPLIAQASIAVSRG